MRSPVKYLCNGPEGLLSGSVPDLKLEDLFLDLDEVGSKLHAHCDIMVIFEVIFHQALQYA